MVVAVQRNQIRRCSPRSASSCTSCTSRPGWTERGTFPIRPAPLAQHRRETGARALRSAAAVRLYALLEPVAHAEPRWWRPVQPSSSRHIPRQEAEVGNTSVRAPGICCDFAEMRIEAVRIERDGELDSRRPHLSLAPLLPASRLSEPCRPAELGSLRIDTPLLQEYPFSSIALSTSDGGVRMLHRRGNAGSAMSPSQSRDIARRGMDRMIAVVVVVIALRHLPSVLSHFRTKCSGPGGGFCPAPLSLARAAVDTLRSRGRTKCERKLSGAPRLD